MFLLFPTIDTGLLFWSLTDSLTDAPQFGIDLLNKDCEIDSFWKNRKRDFFGRFCMYVGVGVSKWVCSSILWFFDFVNNLWLLFFLLKKKSE
jgi:hypothetical protein